MADERKPWEQQPGEPREAYARFLMYRNLGPVRSLDTAYNESRPVTEDQNGSKRIRKRRASGEWRQNCIEYRWLERATAWDIAMLATIGKSAATKYYALIEALAEQTLQTVADGRVKPLTWEDALNALRTLASFIPPETLAALTDTGSTGTAAEGGKPDSSG